MRGRARSLRVMRADQPHEGVLERRLGQLRRDEPLLHRIRAAGGDHPSGIDDAQAVAILGLLHEMRRHQHRDAALGQAADTRPEFASHERIDARRRLVEEQDLRFVQQRASQRQPLLEAERQRPRFQVGDRREVEALDRPGDTA
jgi:hypothetical protein